MYQPAGGQVSGEEEQTQAPSPPPKTQTLSPKSPTAKPQWQPSHTKNPTQSGSGSEEKEQAQSVASPPKQATTSKKRKWSSEADQTPIASTSAAENGGVSGSVWEKSEDEEDLSWAQLNLCIYEDELLIKQGLELLGDEKRAKTEKALKKLQVEVKKLRAMSQALLEEQLMYYFLSDHLLSSLEEEEEHMQQTEASINPAKE